MQMDLARRLAHAMDDRHAQFLFVVADACSGAALGELTVEVLTSDGVRHQGVPTVLEVEEPNDVDRSTLRIGGSVVALSEVVEFLVWPPGEAPDPHRRTTTAETPSLPVGEADALDRAALPRCPEARHHPRLVTSPPVATRDSIDE